MQKCQSSFLSNASFIYLFFLHKIHLKCVIFLCVFSALFLFPVYSFTIYTLSLWMIRNYHQNRSRRTTRLLVVGQNTDSRPNDQKSFLVVWGTTHAMDLLQTGIKLRTKLWWTLWIFPFWDLEIWRASQHFEIGSILGD